MAARGKTWILTGSLDNFRATRDRGFERVGAKERRRRLAEQIEPGDLIVFYVTGVQAFGGIVRVTGGMYEDRRPPEHWQLAFQGQLRTVSRADAELLRRRIQEAAGARSAA